jgi:hypothetical protein
MKIRIDTKKFTVIELEDWLDLNSDNIDFDSDLYDEIHQTHIIDTLSSDYSEIMRQIMQQTPTSYSANDLFSTNNKKSFKKYLSLSKNSSGEIKFKLTSKFSTEKHCYCLPLFEAILTLNNLDQNKTIFNFYQVIKGGSDTIVFTIITEDNPIITPTIVYDHSGNLP